MIELDYSKCKFPIPYSDDRLVDDWFEFNDSTVTPIQPGTLQSKFGGVHDGNAYMLVYRQKTSNPSPDSSPKLPEYLSSLIQSLNAQYTVDRDVYADLK